LTELQKLPSQATAASTQPFAHPPEPCSEEAADLVPIVKESTSNTTKNNAKSKETFINEFSNMSIVNQNDANGPIISLLHVYVSPFCSHLTLLAPKLFIF
jgi:hypothetical protein